MSAGGDAGLDRARAAKVVVADRLRGHAAVNGVGVARDGDGWAVRVTLREPVGDDAVPSEVDGVPVQRRMVGELRPRG